MVSFGGAGGQDLAVGMLHPRQPHGRERDGHRDLAPDHRSRDRAALHVDGHALAQADQVVVGLVVAEGLLRPGAGLAVVVEHLRDAPAVDRMQVLDAGDDGHGGSPLATGRIGQES
jgi:hypothetical protein